MQAIGLTDEQRSKLEELCITYFPEYHGMITVDRVAVLFNGKNPIHWFELCFTHLASRIGQSNSLLTFYRNCLISNLSKVHPVDFLYSLYEEEQEEMKADAQLNILKSQE